MAKDHVYGMVSAEEWKRIGREDEERRAGQVEHDVSASVLTTVSALITLAMLVVGPMWTLIAVVGNANERGAAFDSLWWVPVVLTLVAAVPLVLAMRRERSRARLGLAGLLGGSLLILLATAPWF